MITIGADISMRSSSLVAIDENNKVIDYCIISNKELNDEALMNWNAGEVVLFIDKVKSAISTDICVIMESLSLRSVAGVMDRIIGNHWCIRTAIAFKFGLSPRMVAPTSWKKGVYTRDDLDKIKEARKEKKLSAAGLKKLQKELCVEKLDNKLIGDYNDYIKANKFPKDAIYDLSDATHIARYGTK